MDDVGTFAVIVAVILGSLPISKSLESGSFGEGSDALIVYDAVILSFSFLLGSTAAVGFGADNVKQATRCSGVWGCFSSAFIDGTRSFKMVAVVVVAGVDDVSVC